LQHITGQFHPKHVHVATFGHVVVDTVVQVSLETLMERIELMAALLVI
jgi:hypothetical protein